MAHFDPELKRFNESKINFDNLESKELIDDIGKNIVDRMDINMTDMQKKYIPDAENKLKDNYIDPITFNEIKKYKTSKILFEFIDNYKADPHIKKLIQTYNLDPLTLKKIREKQSSQLIDDIVKNKLLGVPIKNDLENALKKINEYPLLPADEDEIIEERKKKFNNNFLNKLYESSIPKGIDNDNYIERTQLKEKRTEFINKIDQEEEQLKEIEKKIEGTETKLSSGNDIILEEKYSIESNENIEYIVLGAKRIIENCDNIRNKVNELFDNILSEFNDESKHFVYFIKKTPDMKENPVVSNIQNVKDSYFENYWEEDTKKIEEKKKELQKTHDFKASELSYLTKDCLMIKYLNSYGDISVPVPPEFKGIRTSPSGTLKIFPANATIKRLHDELKIVMNDFVNDQNRSFIFKKTSDGTILTYDFQYIRGGSYIFKNKLSVDQFIILINKRYTLMNNSLRVTIASITAEILGPILPKPQRDEQFNQRLNNHITTSTDNYLIFLQAIVDAFNLISAANGDPRSNDILTLSPLQYHPLSWRPIISIYTYKDPGSVERIESSIETQKKEVDAYTKRLKSCDDHVARVKDMRDNRMDKIDNIFTLYGDATSIYSKDKLYDRLKSFDEILISLSEPASGGSKRKMYKYEEKIRKFMNANKEDDESTGNIIHLNNKNIEMIKLYDAKIEYFKKRAELTITQYVLFKKMFDNLFFKMMSLIKNDVYYSATDVSILQCIPYSKVIQLLDEYKNMGDKNDPQLFIYKYFTKGLEYIKKKAVYVIDIDRDYINIFLCDPIIKNCLRLVLLHNKYGLNPPATVKEF
jgi:hypothetical protein